MIYYKISYHSTPTGWQTKCTCSWISKDHQVLNKDSEALKDAITEFHEHRCTYNQQPKPLEEILAERKIQAAIWAQQRWDCTQWGHTLKPLAKRTKPYVACLRCGTQVKPKVTLETYASGTTRN